MERNQAVIEFYRRLGYSVDDVVIDLPNVETCCMPAVTEPACCSQPHWAHTVAVWRNKADLCDCGPTQRVKGLFLRRRGGAVINCQDERKPRPSWLPLGH